MHWISQLEKLREEQQPPRYGERPFLRLPLPVFSPEMDGGKLQPEYDETLPPGVVVFEIFPVEQTSN